MQKQWQRRICKLSQSLSKINKTSLNSLCLRVCPQKTVHWAGAAVWLLKRSRGCCSGHAGRGRREPHWDGRRKSLTEVCVFVGMNAILKRKCYLMLIVKVKTGLDKDYPTTLCYLRLASLGPVISNQTILLGLLSLQGSKTRVWSQERRDWSERKGQEVVRNRLRARGERRF